MKQKQKKRCKEMLVPLLDPIDQLIYDDKETSNLFNDYFLTVFMKANTTILPYYVQFNGYDVLLDLIYFSEENEG